MINFRHHENFNHADIACSDFIQFIAPVINKITAFKKLELKTIPKTALMAEF